MILDWRRAAMGDGQDEAAAAVAARTAVTGAAIAALAGCEQAQRGAGIDASGGGLDRGAAANALAAGRRRPWPPVPARSSWPPASRPMLPPLATTSLDPPWPGAARAAEAEQSRRPGRGCSGWRAPVAMIVPPASARDRGDGRPCRCAAGDRARRRQSAGGAVGGAATSRRRCGRVPPPPRRGALPPVPTAPLVAGAASSPAVPDRRGGETAADVDAAAGKLDLARCRRCRRRRVLDAVSKPPTARPR